ncbi:MAG: hypothetical protein JWM22_2687 [Frankiales bacterium]|nr:hypothetical protein [Frankiales bacterium]
MDRALAWILIPLLWFLGIPYAHAADGADPCYQDPNSAICLIGGGNGFGGAGQGGHPGTPGGGGGSTGSRVNLPTTVKVYGYSPSCTGNTREVADVCGAALNSCQPAGQGLVRYWVWVAEVNTATGKILDPPGWVMQPTTVCLGPDSPGLPAKAAIGGILARDFKDLVVVKGVAHVDPEGSTLVNFDNGFWTDAKTYVLAPVQILGHAVVVTAKPERFDWYFGDGGTAMGAGPGRHGTTEVEHTYTHKGMVRPYVVITWSGTYTVDGGAALDVIGTATTTGDGTPLQVKEAKAQLVSR